MTWLSLRCYLIGVNLILYTGKGIFGRVLILKSHKTRIQKIAGVGSHY